MSNFWQELPQPFFALAPMEAVTDVVFRQVIARAGAPDLFFTEFTNATGWVHAGDRAVAGRLFKLEHESPIVAQIWGGEPGDMEQLATHCRTIGYNGIDINMGCPAKSAVKSGGSALIRQPKLASDSIAAAKIAGLPVSVKTRLGYTRVDEWRDWLTHVLRQDIVNLTIHLRTKKEMSNVPAHHELIPKIVALRDEIAPQTLLTINGDIENHAQGVELVTENPGVNGIMIGRGVFQNPFCFIPNHDNDAGPEEHKKQLLELLEYHFDLYDKWHDKTSRPYDTLKRFFKMYIRDFPDAAALRAALMLTTSTSDARSIVQNHLQTRQPVAKTEVTTYDETMDTTVKAIVFDSDGTLLDTRQMIFEGYKKVLSRHNLEHLATDQYIRQRLGKPTVETMEQLIFGHNVELSAAELAKELDSVQAEMLHYIKLYPHTRELLESWKDDNVKLCLFTSGYNYMVDRNFTAAGIPNVREIFDEIITADDHTARKPEPDAIRELLRRVDVDPANAVVVGDHAYDILAAKKAKVGLAVGVLHGIGTQHELSTAGADFLTTDIASLNHLMSFATR